MSEPTRILLVDDHALLRAGLRLLIESQPQLAVVGKREAVARRWRRRVRCAPI